VARAGLTVLASVLPAAQASMAKLAVDGVVQSIGQGVAPRDGLLRVAPYVTQGLW